MNSKPRTRQEAKPGLRQVPSTMVAIVTLVLCLTSHGSAQGESCGPRAKLIELFNFPAHPRGGEGARTGAS